VLLGDETKENKVNTRLINFYDREHTREIEFNINNKKLVAWEVTEIYKQRW